MWLEGDPDAFASRRSPACDPGNGGWGPVSAHAQERHCLKTCCASARKRVTHSAGRLATRWIPTSSFERCRHCRSGWSCECTWGQGLDLPAKCSSHGHITSLTRTPSDCTEECGAVAGLGKREKDLTSRMRVQLSIFSSPPRAPKHSRPTLPHACSLAAARMQRSLPFGLGGRVLARHVPRS